MRRWESLINSVRPVVYQGHIHGKGGEANVGLKASRFTWVLGKSLGTLINTLSVKILPW